MKKFLGIICAAFACLSLGSCAGNNEEKAMSYNEFMAAESGEDVVIRGFIAAKQGWWENAVTCYLTTETAGEGYFVYGLSCTKEENDSNYAIGQYIQIKGKKTIYAGEHEIMGKDITEVKNIETNLKQAKDPIDLTNKLDNLFDYQNSFFTLTLDVKSFGFKGDKGEDDLYLTLTNGTKDVACCVEAYLTGKDTDVYKTVLSLEDKAGTSVTVKGYLYWWNESESAEEVKANGANPHLVEVVINEK